MNLKSKIVKMYENPVETGSNESNLNNAIKEIESNDNQQIIDIQATSERVYIFYIQDVNNDPSICWD